MYQHNVITLVLGRTFYITQPGTLFVSNQCSSNLLKAFLLIKPLQWPKKLSSCYRAISDDLNLTHYEGCDLTHCWKKKRLACQNVQNKSYPETLCFLSKYAYACICVSDVMLSLLCHRTHAHVITIMLEILWGVTYMYCGTCKVYKCITDRDTMHALIGQWVCSDETM